MNSCQEVYGHICVPGEAFILMSHNNTFTTWRRHDPGKGRVLHWLINCASIDTTDLTQMILALFRFITHYYFTSNFADYKIKNVFIWLFSPYPRLFSCFCSLLRLICHRGMPFHGRKRLFLKRSMSLEASVVVLRISEALNRTTWPHSWGWIFEGLKAIWVGFLYWLPKTSN